MIRRVLLALAVCAATLSACTTLEPAYHRPDAPVPAAFPQGASYAPAQASATDPTSLPWRQVFLDARLQRVVEAALANNRDLRVAAANVEAARALYRVQRAAQFPAVGAGASADVSHAGGRTAQSYSVDVGVSAFELDLFGRLRSLSSAALQRYFATDEARRAAQISLMGETASAWLTLAADRSALQLARDTERAAAEFATLTRQRLQGGISSQLDVSEAETILEQARSNIASLTTQVAQDRNALELLVGAPVPDSDLPDALDEGFVVADVPPGVSSEVLLRRPDVLQAEAQLRAANANIGAARANFFPRISLTGIAGLASAALGQLFTGNAFTWTAGASASAPIFDAGANRANLAYARAQQQAAVATYEGAIQTAFRETADALARRGTITAQLEAEQRLVAAAATGAQLAQARYRTGADTYLTYLTAQRTLYAAQQGLISTRLGRASNIVTLYRTLGGGLT